MSNEFTYEYLPWRGVTADTMRKYNVKTKISSDGKPICLGYQYANASVKVRNLDEKDFYTKGDINQGGLFGRDKFSAGAHKYVTITEGELDALSLYQVLEGPVVSVQSASTASRDVVRDRSWLRSFERIYIAFDNDAVGAEAAALVARHFDYNRVYQVKFDRWKDANEYLLNGEADELRKIWWNSKKYLPATIVSSVSDFKKILEEKTEDGFPYPFPTLTEKTYGIRRGESVLVTAQEGVGKTEFMHAIEHKILKETNDAVGAIYLEEPKKRHLQALAGLELNRPAHLPDSGLTHTEISDAVETLVGSDDRLHVYNHFGSDDPDILLETIRFLVASRNCVYVILDHVSMVVSGLAGEDERRALDYLSSRLEMMVKELNFALIMVSHVNDNGQTRGSRYISKVADIRIDMRRDLENPDVEERMKTYLTISKNRFCGRTGPSGILTWDPETYSLKELGYYEPFLPVTGDNDGLLGKESEHVSVRVPAVA